MKSLHKSVASFFLMCAVLLSSCGLLPSVSQASRTLDQVHTHWNTTVALENQAEAQYLKIQQDTNEGYLTIKNKYPLIDQCYKNSATTLRDAVSGRYDVNAGKTKPSEGLQVATQPLVNALVVNEQYPDITKCQAMGEQIANDITVWRRGRADEFAQLWELKLKLDTQYTGDLYRAMAVQILQYAQEQAQKNGIAVPSYAYPTFNLESLSKDQAICDYYHISWNPALKQCILNAKAAYEYIFRPITAAEVQKTFDTGVDDLDPLAPTPGK